MVLRDGQLFSFRILQRKSSTVWMHFFGPKTIFDATKGAYNAITVQREINTAINTFSLFSDVCRITVKPVATDIRHLNGLDAEFLAAPNRAYNLQDVNPIAAARPARIDYTAYRARRDLKDESAAAPLPSTDLPKVATAERMVALLKNSIESPGGEPNNGTLLLDKPARKGLEKMAHPSVTQDSLPEIAPRPIYRHRQRLHLS
ncbi:MAG: hypothetical protein H6901_08155 [Rhodobacteraceae bacterium]|nr:hypothetical protein [Paracoccaceae bacterium]